MSGVKYQAGALLKHRFQLGRLRPRWCIGSALVAFVELMPRYIGEIEQVFEHQSGMFVVELIIVARAFLRGNADCG